MRLAGLLGAGLVLGRHEGMELVHEHRAFGGRQFLHARGILFQRLVVAFHGRAVFRLLDRAGRQPGDADAGRLGLPGDALEPIHIGLESLRVELGVAAVVHAEIDGQRRGLEGRARRA